MGGGNFAMLDICTNFAISKNRKKNIYHTIWKKNLKIIGLHINGI